MPVDLKDIVSRKLVERWGGYFAKAVVLVAVFLLIGRLGPSMPPMLLALVWAVLSTVSAIGLVYHRVITKARKRYGLKGGGVVARLNGGRVISLVFAFAASAVFMGGLILELPKWEFAEWLLLALAVFLYVVVYQGVKRLLVNEYEPLLQVSRTVKVSSAILCVVLLLVYALVSLTGPAATYDSMTEAFLAAKQPFAQSSSALLADAGYLTALVDGLTSFAMSRVAEGSLWIYVVWRVVLCGSVALAVSSLVSACSLRLSELKLVFMPLDAVEAVGEGVQKAREVVEVAGEGAEAAVHDVGAREVDASISKASSNVDELADEEHVATAERAYRVATASNGHILKRYVVLACAFPLVLVACFAVADAKIASVAETEGYTTARAFIRDQVGMAACVIDGKPYDYEKVQELCKKAQKLSDDLASEREKVLTPLINEAFDQRIQNIDRYLDWYYSLPADYERLAQFFTGQIEAGLRDQLVARINEGVDESELNEKIDYYWNKSTELIADIEGELAEYELSNYDVGDVPDWLVVPMGASDSNVLAGPLEPTQKFLDAGERMGLSAGIGAIAGVIAAKVVKRVAAKPFFKKIVASLTEKLAARGLLAAGGTLIAPVVGTAVGVGIGFVGDYLFLKADEAMNRDSYRQEIVDAIEDSRAEMLALVSAG